MQQCPFMSIQNTASCSGSDQIAPVFCFTQALIIFGSMPTVFVSTASRIGIFQNEMSFHPTSGTPVSTAFCGNCASADKGKVECECSHFKARCSGASLHLRQSGPLPEPHRRPEFVSLQVQHREGTEEVGGLPGELPSPFSQLSPSPASFSLWMSSWQLH